MTVTRLQAGEMPQPPARPDYVETPTRRGARSIRREGSKRSKDDANPETPAPAKSRSRSVKRSGSSRTPQAASPAKNGAAKATRSRSTATRVEKPRASQKDISGEYEFGGPYFISVMMVGFPLLMYYMWIGATYYDGKFPVPQKGQSWLEFAALLGELIYQGAFPTLKAFAIYWTFFVVEAAFYIYMPGITVQGKPLEWEKGLRLDYYCSGMWSFYSTIVILVLLHVTGLFELYTILDEFGPLLSVAIISGFAVSLVAYVSAIWRGKEHRMSGNVIYDFWMGAELNPRLFGLLDFKMFFEVRLPWYILFLLSAAAATRQYEQYGYVSGEVWFVLMAHFLYVNACSKAEEAIVTSWDMYYEKWGFMLIFWNMAGVPLSYCHCTIYLANHPPSDYHWNPAALTFLFMSYLAVYYVWDTCNAQKNRFKQAERGTISNRKTFPQLPWQEVKNPRTITAKNGTKIFVDGWYKYARKVHYTCDIYFAFTWGLITGFASPFPWFYTAFFIPMIIHRAWRDQRKCRESYGVAWLEYEREVPYVFVPYLI